MIVKDAQKVYCHYMIMDEKIVAHFIEYRNVFQVSKASVKFKFNTLGKHPINYLV